MKNQLTRVDDQEQNRTFTYTYDRRGNLLTKTEYPFTTGTLGTALSTVNYGYADTVWNDLLTSYNGGSITYDAIGNPLTWYDGRVFMWQNKRAAIPIIGGFDLRIAHGINC